MSINPLAGKPAPASMLVNVPRLICTYYSDAPDPAVPDQKVAFGTSGHRGSSLQRSFNEAHILAITQAIVMYRSQQGINGPLFLGMDTHALSEPAFVSALEVLGANGVTVMIADEHTDYTPTPVISHAILTYNRGRSSALADGIVITPSHNPPDSGGFKYNPPNGGPADTAVTSWIQNKANELLGAKLDGVRRMPFNQARSLDSTHRHDYRKAYVDDLAAVIDLDAIRASGVHMGVDPLGGAGVHYWPLIAEQYKLDLTITNDAVDPTFRFMTLDWDGRIRMDPSSPYAMQRLIALKERFDIAFACDTDHDRHGVVTRSAGLMPPNHYLTVAAHYLFSNRPQWSSRATIGKTVVTSMMLEKVAEQLGRKIYETPVGFKWFVDGLVDGSLGFVCEESAGASLLRRDGSVWTTDKDGITAALLAGEITARAGKDPAQLYTALTGELGNPAYERVDAPADAAQRQALSKLSGEQIKSATLAGEKIEAVLTKAPGNGAAIGGVKVISASGWFAARPSGTESIYKIYAESLRGPEHLQQIFAEAQQIVGAALK
ncbi:MAG TPA: phosphoglucomutase (alpha-D-glucose-1,6-bisphosphate-dependent) [Steroidobacteraceae bacterium]|jgi:phosphoglucomutase|nr:phosphoglucomutase (alpha-D-glucose-1,6-bisphosphate-dependent) [Steroidobacteraceae bacterium]